jgi:beta-glucosidase
VAQVLSGQANPGGRLPVTFYESLAELPPFDDYAMAGRTYRYFAGKPVYPFGHGLSYTSFSYGPLKVAATGGKPELGLTVTTEITNTGARDGDEVAQLYLTPPPFEGAPRLALRGFERVSLKAGQTRQVSFQLSPRDLSFVTRDGQRQLMAGQHTLNVGSGQPGEGSSGQSAAFTLNEARTIAP